MQSCNLEFLDLHAPISDIEDYFERFELWCIACKNVSEEQKTAVFLSVVGKSAYSVIKNLAFPKKPVSLPYDDIKKLVLRHTQPINFEIAERAKFHQLQRKESQPIREFILQLQTQATRCNFGDQLETQLRDRLIAGINCQSLQQNLLLLSDPTFQRVREVCEQYQDVNSLTESTSQIMLCNRSNDRRKGHPVTRRRFEQRNKYSSEKVNSGKAQNTLGLCDSCGKQHSRATCRFRNTKCFKCGKIGHIQSVCRRFQACYSKPSDDPSSDDNQNLSLAVSTSSQKHILRSFLVGGKINHHFIVDTGSVESFIPINVVQQAIPCFKLRPTDTVVKGITGHTLPIMGKCEIPLTDSNGNSFTCDFLVIRSGPSILGLKSIKDLGITISLLSHTTVSIRDLILRCSKAVGGMKIPPVKLEVDGEPVFVKRRVLSYGLREPVKKVLDSLVSAHVLEPVSSSKWATPIVTPLKSDGKTPRICGDYRVTLNNRLRQQTCTTEEPEDILSRFNGSCYFSRLDLKDAYLQIPLHADSRELTTINTPFGLYSYRFLPFGLSVSPAIFQSVMNSIIDGLPGVECYQDDIVIHGTSKAEHDERLHSLLLRFCEFNVAINPSKCIFGSTSLEFLGYLVDKDGYKPDPNRLAPLLSVHSPTNFGELNSLVGSLQYYSRFIPHFSNTMAPIFELLSSGSFHWSHTHEQILRSILNFLKTKAFLRSFSSKKHSTLITDASPTGIGAVLEQDGYPVICVSRKLSAAEKGYSQTQREALAVYWAVNRLHKYLFGLKFTIVSDHEALRFLYHPAKSLHKSTSAMVHRWCISLAAYDYDIQHRGAKQIPHVDYISRYACSSDDFESDALLVQPPVDCGYSSMFWTSFIISQARLESHCQTSISSILF